MPMPPTTGERLPTYSYISLPTMTLSPWRYQHGTIANNEGVGTRATERPFLQKTGGVTARVKRGGLIKTKCQERLCAMTRKGRTMYYFSLYANLHSPTLVVIAFLVKLSSLSVLEAHPRALSISYCPRAVRSLSPMHRYISPLPSSHSQITSNITELSPPPQKDS